jgi:hypothetical protein
MRIYEEIAKPMFMLAGVEVKVEGWNGDHS